MAIREIAFTCYAVTDMTRARSFYEDVLGLIPSTVFDSPDGSSQWVEYEIGDGAFSLGLNPAWKPSPEGASVAFEVDDFDATIEKIRSAGVTFRTEPMATPVCRMAMILDPDGSTVCIHQRNTPTDAPSSATCH